MSEHVALVSLREGADVAGWCQRWRQRVPLAVPTLPGGLNAGHAIVRTTEPFVADGDVVAVDAAEPEVVAAGGRPVGRGIYRVALFNANRDSTAERLAAFEAELLSLPAHVGVIERWRLSRTAGAYTHVWEQEYASLDGLNGAYKMHPIHWAAADSWFDPDFPEWLVDPHLCHAFSDIDGPAW
jgi:hypothetical protein